MVVRIQPGAGPTKHWKITPSKKQANFKLFSWVMLGSFIGAFQQKWKGLANLPFKRAARIIADPHPKFKHTWITRWYYCFWTKHTDWAHCYVFSKEDRYIEKQTQLACIALLINHVQFQLTNLCQACLTTQKQRGTWNCFLQGKTGIKGNSLSGLDWITKHWQYSFVTFVCIMLRYRYRKNYKTS